MLGVMVLGGPLALAALSFGCSPDLRLGQTGDLGASEQTGNLDATAEDLCTVLKTGLANQAIWSAAKDRCMAGDPPPAFIESQPDGAAQVDALRAECKSGDWMFDLFDNAIKGGRVRFDAERLASCLAKGKMARATSSPEVFQDSTLNFSDDPDCVGIAIPLVMEGGECVESWDCPAGTKCEANDPRMGPLTCLKPAGPGAKCSPFRTCDPMTLFCNVEGTCAPRVGVGSPCSFADECVVGAYCPMGMCEWIPQAPPPAADGDPCDGKSCAAPCSVCRPETDGGQFKCLARATAGNPCGSADSACVAGLYCNSVTSHCEAPLGMGENCSVQGVRCGENLWCANGVCVALPGLGGDCSQSLICESGLSCSLDMCIAGEWGDRCDPLDSTVCQDPLVCRGAFGEEKCQPPLNVGEACSPGLCADGAFCNALGQCEALQEAGAQCKDASECKGDCYQGQCVPSNPGGCGDMTDVVGPLLGLGVMSVLSRRKSLRRRA